MVTDVTSIKLISLISYISAIVGELAQMARALALHARGPVRLRYSPLNGPEVNGRLPPLQGGFHERVRFPLCPQYKELISIIKNYTYLCIGFK